MQKSKEQKRVIIYCRESRDDYGENYERIETQRDLLVKYCKSHGYTNIIDIVMDDDKSGTDFSRFEQIKRQAKNKEIDVIVFKNSARLGRNQKEALQLVDYLEEQGVEIIFEDEKYDEEMFGLYAWFNERRARDDSKNIRRNLRHKIEEGQLIVKPIYGYDKKDKKLVINPDTAPVVQKIFELYVQGWGYNKIASYLNKEKIPTPSQKRSYTNTKQSENWNVQHVWRILEDRRYVGDYVGGRTEKISFKSKKTIVKPQEEWTIIKNNHEPIIEKELFEKVQRLRAKKGNATYTTRFKRLEAENNKYSGLIKCGRCGSYMYKKKGNTTHRYRPDSYLCGKYYKEGKIKSEIRQNYGCKSHRTRIEYLDKIIDSYINNLIDNDEFRNYAVNNVNAISNNVRRLNSNIQTAKNDLNKYERQYKQVYEDKLNGIIPEFVYLDKVKNLEKNIENTKYLINEYQNNLNQACKENNKEKVIYEEIENIISNGLTKEELSKIFDRIIVYDKGEISQKEKEKYNLKDEIYQEILQEGGIIICLKFKCPQTIASRRM